MTVFVRSILLATIHVLTGLISTCICSANPGARWDDSALAGSGAPSFSHETVPAFGEGMLIDGALLTISYTGEDSSPWHLVLCREGEIWSIPNGLERDEERFLTFDLKEYLGEKPLGERPETGKALPLMLGGVLDREWPRRPFLYIACNQLLSPEPMNFILRFRVEGGSPLRVVGEPEVMISWESNGHNGCDLRWGPEDGYLYASAGDGSRPGDPDNIGQQVDMIRGSILRLDFHGEPDPGLKYAIPRDNPFVHDPGVRPELWCYGLRNPWRMAFHPQTGELWLGDNGDETWEMIHRVTRGCNFGWSAFEGSHPFRTSNPLSGPTPVHTPPRIEHPHTVMRSIIGGVFYRGEELEELTGHYLYGCYVSREIWAASYDSKTDELGDPFRIARASGPLVSIREDLNRELLITSLDGHIERLKKREEVPAGRPWPEKFSETGLFLDVENHEPAPGVYEYLIKAEGWADGATRRRFVAIPRGGGLIALGHQHLYKSFRVDPGGAFAQTFFLEGSPVETQVLYNDGIWVGYTYRWNRDGTDAVLVPKEGKSIEVDLSDGSKQDWRFPSRSECHICHTQRSHFALAFTPVQLDRPGIDGVSNQLDSWLASKLLRKTKFLVERREDRIANPYDPSSGTLAERARAYLDVNCAHCHREAGLGGRATFQLMSHIQLSEMGLINKTPMVPMLGKAGACVIVPGDPELSELLGRMNRRGPGQMPLFGSTIVDERGCDLIREWILSLEER